MNCRKKYSSRFLISFMIVVFTYLFLLVMSYGFPVTGDDWWFTSRFQNEGFLEALKRGIGVAKGHAITTNGRFLGNAFSGIFGCSDLFRELFRCMVILGIHLLVCKYCKIQNIYYYLITLVFIIAVPTKIFSQTYAWAAGFFNYVPPVFLLLLFFVSINHLLLEDNVKEKWYQVIPLFILGLCTQFFVENITVAVCLLSLTLFVWHIVKNKQLSWKLLGYLLGTFLGAILMFSVPGYQSVGVEGYREVPSGLDQIITTAVQNFGTISGYITEKNWLVIGSLTITCLYLLYKKQEKNKKEKMGTIISSLFLCIPVLYFYIYQNFLLRMDYKGYIMKMTFVLNVISNVAYLIGLIIIVKICVEKKSLQNKLFLCLITVLFLIIPLLVVTPIGPRCFYVTYILMVCFTLIIINYVRFTYLNDLSITKFPVIFGCAAILLAYLWVMIWNGHAETVRTQYTEEQIQQLATEIILPEYPYPEFVHGGSSQTITNYYYYAQPGDIKFIFVPYEQWSR